MPVLPVSNWSLYPALVDALQQRDWATMTALYENGAPVTALFPETIGQMSLDMNALEPMRGRLNLPMAFLMGHVVFHSPSVAAHDRPLWTTLWPNGDADHQMACLRSVFDAWQRAGGQWDEAGVVSTNPNDPDAVTGRSVTAFTVDQMTPNKGWRLSSFEADFQPWLTVFLQWGWSPCAYDHQPMAHHAARLSQFEFAEDVRTYDPTGAQRFDTFGRTPLHRVTFTGETLAFLHVQERLHTWLVKQPDEDWHARDAEGVNALERWAIQQDWALMKVGLNVTQERGLAVVFSEAAQEKARAKAEESDQTSEFLEVLAAWEQQHLLATLSDDPATGLSLARTRARL